MNPASPTDQPSCTSRMAVCLFCFFCEYGKPCLRMDTCRRDDWNIRIHNTQQIADRNIQSFDSAKKTQTSALRKTPGICLSGKSSGVISSFYRFQLIDCIRLLKTTVIYGSTLHVSQKTAGCCSLRLNSSCIGNIGNRTGVILRNQIRRCTEQMINAQNSRKLHFTSCPLICQRCKASSFRNSAKTTHSSIFQICMNNFQITDRTICCFCTSTLT